MNWLKSFILIILFGVLPGILKAQNFEWLKAFGAIDMDQPAGVVAEANGGSVFLHNYQGKADTLLFDTIEFNDYHTYQNYLVRMDSNGKVLKAIPIGNDGLMRLKGDGNGNYYVGGYSNGNDSVVKFDKNFNRIWSFKLTKIGLVRSLGLNFSNGHLYVNGITNDSNRMAEVNTSNGNVIWAKNLSKNKYQSFLQLNSVVHLKGKLYMSGKVTGAEGFKIGPDTIYGWSGFVIQTDSFGNYEKRFLLQCKWDNVSGGIYSLATDGNFLYISGNYRDTVYWGNKKITPEYPSSADHNEFFAASLTASLQPRWFFRPKVLDKTDIQKSVNYLSSVVCSKGLIYFSGQYVSKILIDSNILTSPTNIYSIIILKADSLGNILWATNSGRGGGRAYCMDAQAGQSVYVAGVFFDSISLGKHAKYNPRNGFDVFVTKITDYSITRGRVNSGPYCAGDTIKIPYTKFGIFDTANRFVAQLSDEYGNFDKAYELGRLKSNKDGTIMGKLPLFKVVSSKLYRIRIISTSPKIQSYYRTDTLRLLIYSKDKADPGLPETICKGDTLKLNTYGGTKWTWSPKYNISNIAQRQPLVWPMRDTIYRIVIADSSGCGKPDTAFKKVFVKPYPKSNLQFSDTMLCENIPLKIPVRFSGGDSTYQWEWYFVNSDKTLFSMKKGKSKFTDTLYYIPTVDQKTSERLAILLKDGCTSKTDTAYVNISQRKPALINNQFKDTTLCSGKTLNYKAVVSGGVSKYYKYQWRDLISNTILSTNDSLQFITAKTQKIQLIVNDGCEALGDTAMFTIKINPPLKVTSNLRDTILCFGKHVNYTAKVTGGDSTAYNFTWLIGNSVISTNNPFLLKTEDLILAKGELKTFSLVSKDNCTFPNDTIKVKLIVNASPKANFTWDLACSKTATKFQFTGTKPANPISTTFRWNLNNEATSSVENPSHLFSTPGTKSLTLILASDNGCTDTLKKTIDIKPQSKADFTSTDVCETDSAVFKNLSKDATGYNWKFGDGLKSTKESPKHKYQITSTTTFNVTLVAVVGNGCSDSIVKAISINANPNSNFTYKLTGSKIDLTAAVQGNTKYVWKFGTMDSATTTNGSHTFNLSKPSQYNVCLKVTNLAGCLSQTCQNIPVSIHDISKPSGYKIYPNPSTGNLFITVPDNSKHYLSIWNISGQMVFEQTIKPASKEIELDLKGEFGLTGGVYFIRLQNSNATELFKLVLY